MMNGSKPYSPSGGVRNASVYFPLTPSLSLGERENRRQAVRGHGAVRPATALGTVPPLPEGEGRGEGEPDAA